MLKTYKSIKDHNAKSGNNRKTWPYFDQIDSIFGTKPWIAPSIVLESDSIKKSQCSQEASSSSGSSSSSELLSTTTQTCSHASLEILNDAGPPRNKGKTTEHTSISKLIQSMESSTEERCRMHEDIIKRQDKL